MKKDRRKVDIKSKLVAAIAMLMVSCIMVVSSTYAWFTLSTAPEVTGISTAIGANGNLEMALLPGFNGDVAYTDVTDALKGIGDAQGNMTVVEKNTTWGNLVDLKDGSYGLNQITLNPSKLALSENKLADYYLGTPQYGADGRFIGLATSASAASYKNGTFGTNAFGVRAVGTSSGMSAMELAYRDVLSTANDAFNKAITQTKTATTNGGSALASMAVAKASGATSFGQEDIGKLKIAYTNIDTALNSVENALKQYIIAFALSNGSLNETTYLAAMEAMQDMDLAEMNSYASEAVKGYITALSGLRTNVAGKLSTLNGMTGESYSWTEISGFVTPLADIDTMKLNNNPIEYYMEKDGEGNWLHIDELIGNMSNLVLEVDGADTGIYAQMADFVGSYTAPVTISGSFAGITANNLAATMKVNTSENPAFLAGAKTAASNPVPGAFGTGGGSSLSDFYGYIIDMAFRTNAAGSSLQLQTEAVDRVYADNESNEYTMGHGSSMTFSVADVEGYSVEQLQELMGFIRVVFFNPADNSIFGYARLDASTAVVKGTSVTMQLKMWDESANDGAGAWADSSVITELTQNAATAVSTLVYLDGERLTNAHVANAELTGTMNIQFSSTAELKPMEYGDLRNGNTETKSEYNASVTFAGATLETKTVVADGSYTYNLKSYADSKSYNLDDYNIVIKMGGTDVTSDVFDPETGVLNITKVTGDIVVEVTLKG